ncbi:MAG: hypothetical protein ACFB4I_16775 [Cyanophyceae cyanobacterium]
MTDSTDNDRFSRIETVLETLANQTQANAQSIQSLETLTRANAQSIQSLENQTRSNARSIQALTDNLNRAEAQAAADRSRLYEAMADLANAQAAYYRRLEVQDQLVLTLARRQGEIVEILKLLSSREDNS